MKKNLKQLTGFFSVLNINYYININQKIAAAF